MFRGQVFRVGPDSVFYLGRSGEHINQIQGTKVVRRRNLDLPAGVLASFDIEHFSRVAVGLATTGRLSLVSLGQPEGFSEYLDFPKNRKAW